ncbi:hypothetical protein QQ045_024309 [Rhodiola kirilowii]
MGTEGVLKFDISILFDSQSPRFVSSMASLRSTIASGSVSGDRDRSGEVHVIVGPMFAGKTTALLRRIKLEDNSGRSVAMIKSSKDTRYAVDSVVTHDGVKFPCWALPNLTSFRGKFGLEAYDELDVIGIDEAQFFEDLYDFCCTVADKDGKIIIVAGLDGDFLRLDLWLCTLACCISCVVQSSQFNLELAFLLVQ